jgi:hypothetical protein
MRAVSLYSWFITLLVATLFGCSNPSPAEAPSAATVASADAESAEAEDALELLPVAAPENIVGLATLRTPGRVLDTVMSWTGLGLDWRALAQSGPMAQLLPVVDLEAPVDVVATIDPKVKNRPRVLFAASIGLVSRARALEAFHSLDMPTEFVEPGVDSVRPSAKTVCFIAAALGQARARLVCSEDRESLDLLSPYLTRGNPSAVTGDADLHAELRAESAWRLFGEKAQFLKLGVPMLLGEVSIGNPEFDAALREAAEAIVDELILGLGDLNDVRLDAWLRSPPNAPPPAEGNELELKLGIDFKNVRSWVASTLADGEGRASVAPDTFWRLPREATEAIYYSASNPETTDRALGVLERMFQSGLGHLGASAAAQRQWPLALRQAFSVKGPLVSARGNVPATLLAAKPDAREEIRASLGYTLLGVEDAANRYGALLEQTLRLYEDPTLRKGLSQKYGLDPARLPRVQSKKGPARLAESRAYEVSVPPALYVQALEQSDVDPASLGGPLPLTIITFREGERTWIGFSSYAQLVEDRLTSLITPGGPDTTLATRPGLDRLRTERANVAGYWTLAGSATGSSLEQSDLRKFLASLGQSDVPILGRASGYAKGPSGELQVRVPARLFRDVATSLASKQR